MSHFRRRSRRPPPMDGLNKPSQNGVAPLLLSFDVMKPGRGPASVNTYKYTPDIAFLPVS